MSKEKDIAPRERPPGGGDGPRPPGLVKCPHCGRLVPRQEAGDPAPVFRCPACGLEIKERHLA